MEIIFRLMTNKSSYIMIHHAVNTLSENGTKHLPIFSFFYFLGSTNCDSCTMIGPVIELMGIAQEVILWPSKTKLLINFFLFRMFFFCVL